MAEHKNELPIGYTSFIDLYKDAVKNFESIGVIFKDQMIIRTVTPEHTYECTHDFIVSKVLIEVLKLEKFSVSRDVDAQAFDHDWILQELKGELKQRFLTNIRSIENDLTVVKHESTSRPECFTLSINAYL